MFEVSEMRSDSKAGIEGQRRNPAGWNIIRTLKTGHH